MGIINCGRAGLYTPVLAFVGKIVRDGDDEEEFIWSLKQGDKEGLGYRDFDYYKRRGGVYVYLRTWLGMLGILTIYLPSDKKKMARHGMEYSYRILKPL